MTYMEKHEFTVLTRKSMGNVKRSFNPQMTFCETYQIHYAGSLRFVLSSCFFFFLFKNKDGSSKPISKYLAAP